MKRLLVLGPCGSGKSSLTRKLAPLLRLPAIHLDQHHWLPGWKARPQDEWRQELENLIQGDSWIIDGNYSLSLELRLAAADTVIWLDLPRRVCLMRVLRRTLSNYGRVRPDLASGCPEHFELEFIHYVWRFWKDQRPQLLQLIEAYSNRVTIYKLHTSGEVTAFVENLSGPRTSGRWGLSKRI